MACKYVGKIEEYFEFKGTNDVRTCIFTYNYKNKHPWKKIG